MRYLPDMLTLFSMRMTPSPWKERVSFCMRMTRVNNVLHGMIMMVVYHELFYESKLPGGVVMLYKNLQKFADKMNHKGPVDIYLTSLDSLLCVTYCIT